MSECQGDIAIGCKVDKPMQEFIDAEAARCGVARAELLRRVLDDFRESRREQLDCPECGQTVVLNPCP
jgi:ribosomal protein L37AE/L43A